MAIRSHKHPVDMLRWKDGIGARELFAEELKDGYRYEISEIWKFGMVGEPQPIG
jgi:hypothetical protein